MQACSGFYKLKTHLWLSNSSQDDLQFLFQLTNKINLKLQNAAKLQNGYVGLISLVTLLLPYRLVQD